MWRIFFKNDVLLPWQLCGQLQSSTLPCMFYWILLFFISFKRAWIHLRSEALRVCWMFIEPFAARNSLQTFLAGWNGREPENGAGGIYTNSLQNTERWRELSPGYDFSHLSFKKLKVCKLQPPTSNHGIHQTCFARNLLLPRSGGRLWEIDWRCQV